MAEPEASSITGGPTPKPPQDASEVARQVQRNAKDKPLTRLTVTGLAYSKDIGQIYELAKRINQEGTTQAGVTCPACNHEFTVEMAGDRLGGS